MICWRGIVPGKNIAQGLETLCFFMQKLSFEKIIAVFDSISYQQINPTIFLT